MANRMDSILHTCINNPDFEKLVCGIGVGCFFIPSKLSVFPDINIYSRVRTGQFFYKELDSFLISYWMLGRPITFT